MFFQETKVIRSGRIKTKTAEKGEKGGGVAIGVLNDLEPLWISEGDDDAEAITVEIWLEGFPRRLICAYGPKKDDRKEQKDKFLSYCEKEVKNAKEDGTGIILQMDGNLWAGENVIENDPRKQNNNGK